MVISRSFKVGLLAMISAYLHGVLRTCARTCQAEHLTVPSTSCAWPGLNLPSTIAGMKTQHDLAALAANYHKALPGRIRQYLNNRGITDILIDFHLLGWNGNRITIPIFNRAGEITFFKLAKDPQDQTGPKIMASPGGYAELYGWSAVLTGPSRIIICEGEFDRLVLESQGFIVATSTAGAGVFRKEWAREFADIRE